MIAVTFLLLFLECLCNVYAVPCGSHFGKEFYIGMITVQNLVNNFTIDIASPNASSAFLSIPFLNINRNETLYKGSTTLTISSSLNRSGTFTENLGVFLRTDTPVAVYVTWTPAPSLADSYLALPVCSLGTRYTTASYDPCSVCVSDRSEMMVFALHNNTAVSIDGPYNRGSTLTLNHYDVYKQGSQKDISHTEIVSDKPVAVISGASCSSVPQSIDYCDIILEQMIPHHAWDKTFIISPLYPKTGYLLKIFSDNNATVCLRNNTRTVCNPSQTNKEYLMGNEPTVVTAHDPVSIVQYGIGKFYDNIDGGPFMTVVPGLNNYLNIYHFIIPNVYAPLINYLAISIHSTEVGGLLLDGTPLVPLKSYGVPDPLSKYTVLIVKVTAGYHDLVHSNKHVLFGVTAYGFGRITGYGFPIGFGMPSEPFLTTKPATAATKVSTTAASLTTQKETLLNRTDLTCYFCDDLSRLEMCDVVKHCTSDEVCYLKSHVKYGRKLYQTGCLQRQTCLKEMEAYHTVPDRCVECCSQSYCNSKGCGDDGLVPHNQRGPLCYDCPYEQFPQECSKLSLCEQHEVCSIEEYRWGEHSHFIMGCTDEPCVRTAHTERIAARAVPVCRSCCTDDYCNINCARTTDGSILIGKLTLKLHFYFVFYVHTF